MPSKRFQLNRILLLIIFTLMSLTNSKAQIAFDDNFENGRLDTVYTENSSYVLWPITNLHFRITNTLGQNPAFKIYDSTGYQLRPYHNMVYRYEGDSLWNFFDTAYKSQNPGYYHFINQSLFVKDTVYIAYWYPYTYSDLQQYLLDISGSPYLINSGIKSHSYQGRNIYGYEITDSSYSECYKENVVITCRQHPIENISGYFVEGLTDYLLNTSDSTAAFLRRNFHFYVYPMLNPDGVYSGSSTNALGQGLNREWRDSLIISGTPEIDSIRPVIWQETGQKVNWSIDIHSNAGNNIPYYWWGYDSTAPVPQWQKAKALQYVQAVAAADSSSPDNISSYSNYIQGFGVDSSNTAANWFRRSFSAITFTFEPTTEPMGPSGNNDYTIDNLISAGNSLAKGFFQVFDTIQALGGTIHSYNNTLIVTASGGHPPYSYSWNGPSLSNSDTLQNPISGPYTLTVTDSLGCIWEKQFYHSATDIYTVSPSDGDLTIYPNPTSDDLFWIRFSNPNGPATILIHDLNGRLITTIESKNQAMIPVSTESFISGTYLLKITSKDFILNKRVVIIH